MRRCFGQKMQVVNVMVKGVTLTRSGMDERDGARRTLVTLENALGGQKLRVHYWTPGRVWRKPTTAPRCPGIGGMLSSGARTETENMYGDAKGKGTAEKMRGPKVPSGGEGRLLRI